MIIVIRNFTDPENAYIKQVECFPGPPLLRHNDYVVADLGIGNSEHARSEAEKLLKDNRNFSAFPDAIPWPENGYPMYVSISKNFRVCCSQTKSSENNAIETFGEVKTKEEYEKMVRHALCYCSQLYFWLID